MKKRIVWASCAMAWVVSPFACATVPTESTTELANPIFWQIDGVSGDGEPNGQRLYLLGSIHVGPKGGWTLPDSVMKRFEASKTLVVEIDMRDDANPEDQNKLILSHGLLPPGESLENHVSATTYAMLERHTEKSGQSLADLNPWRAWMISTMLMVAELQRLGYPTETGVDVDLMSRVSARQDIVGLETMDEQLSLLSGMTSEHQELMLKDMLLQVDDIELYFDELKEAWRTGDEAGLQDLLFRELAKTPELAPFYERVIYARNETMCEKLATLLARGDTLFGVVGAYHVTGPRGIPACLKKRGFRTTRVQGSGKSH